jgi:hypothetical protein
MTTSTSSAGGLTGAIAASTGLFQCAYVPPTLTKVRCRRRKGVGCFDDCDIRFVTAARGAEQQKEMQIQRFHFLTCQRTWGKMVLLLRMENIRKRSSAKSQFNLYKDEAEEDNDNDGVDEVDDGGSSNEDRRSANRHTVADDSCSLPCCVFVQELTVMCLFLL